MTTCARCGHTVEVGRFCTNCGAPVDQGDSGIGPADRTDTAERPAVRPEATLPAVGQPPAPARYPLFADEVSGPPGPPPSDPPPVWETEPVPAPPGGGSHRRRTSALAWGVVVAAVLVVVALVGVVLVVGGLGDDDPAADDTPAASPTPDDEPTRSGRPKPSKGPSEPTGSVEPDDLATTAEIEVPSTAPPGTDVDGRRIRYDASRMVDGDPGTCWRMTGDGTGEEIVLTLPEPTTISAVGLINGYAKTATDGKREIDWYAGNRRILTVDWVLDDGTTVRQDLTETRKLQAVDIDPVETTTVTLRLVEVSKPGTGRSARDNTAISELVLVGDAG
jgi:hypothetical protein